MESPSLLYRLGLSATRLLPRGLRTKARKQFCEGRFVPPRGFLRFGSLGRVTPISRDWGAGRGQSIDRYYIDRFLEAHAGDIRGRVLEAGEDSYTSRVGGDAVESLDVLNIDPEAPGVTVVADLADAPGIPDNSYDCVVLTQTLQYIFDLRAAMATLHRILAPGGVVLATAPGLTQIVECAWRDSWHWGLTHASATRLFREHFLAEDVHVHTPGNVLAATALLQGIAAEELGPKKLAHDDQDYQLLVTVRAQKASGA